MATLASTVIDRVVQPFQVRDASDLIADAGGLTTTDTQITITEDYRVGEGSVLEIEGELCLVTDWDSTNKIADVVRGWMGTTPTSHAKDTIIIVSPRIYRFMILDLINNCLVDMYPRLFQVGSQSLSYSSSSIGYELDADADMILSVVARVNATSGEWRRVNDWEKVTDLDTGVFTSGQAIMIRESQAFGAPIRVTYTKPFARLTAESQDLEAVAGLADYMVDLPFYFAMSRLMANEEAERSQSQSASNHQRAQDVPGFLALRTGEWYFARYTDLLNTCRARLAREHRKVMSVGYGG